MRIRNKFFLFLILVHGAALALSFFVFRENKILFIASELVILVSAVIGFQLYRELTQPMKLLLTGIDAIRDRDFNVKFQKTGKEETDKLIAVYNEMIDHLREERTRQQQQHFFLDKLIQTSPVGIVILDYDNHIVEVNPRAREVLQLNDDSNPAGLSLTEIDHPVTRTAAEVPTGSTRSVSIQGTETYKISKAHFIDRGFARPFLMVEELTADILRAEKETYGKVIRMMAHEVNNSIGAVNSLLQAVTSYEEMLPDKEAADFREALDVCIERNDRLNRFMRNFADVVRLPDPTRESCDLRRLLSDIAGLMQESAAERGIRLLTDLPPEPVTVSLDIQQMELVLLNAIKNALESIGREGTVELRLLPEPRSLIIRDNGPGIDPALAEKIFSPFFTTKREGQGIGLTLSREILLNHGFGFSLKTGEDGWTEFVISFPG